MSIEEENKAFILKGYEFVNKRDVTSYINLHDPDFIEHMTDGDLSLEQISQSLYDFYKAFPDAQATVEMIVAEGDRVAWRVTHRGTHQGEFMGIPPTGNKIEMTNTGIARIVDGRWLDSWVTMDNLRLMQQLGAIPSQ